MSEALFERLREEVEYIATIFEASADDPDEGASVEVIEAERRAYLDCASFLRASMSDLIPAKAAPPQPDTKEE
jgi:hypothetical protein